jgi:hypothetical protein
VHERAEAITALLGGALVRENRVPRFVERTSPPLRAD